MRALTCMLEVQPQANSPVESAGRKNAVVVIIIIVLAGNMSRVTVDAQNDRKSFAVSVPRGLRRKLNA